MRLKRSFWFVSLLVLMVVSYSGSILACTSIIVGKDASVDGSVLTSHTCDGNYDARVRVIAGQKFEKGVMTPIYKDLCYDTLRTPRKVGEIPQVAETYTYFHVGYPFMNEHQVIIGEATWNGRAELGNSQGMLMIEQLEALGLQRAKTARECIQVMGALAEKYGYGDGGEGLTIIDSNEAWLFEICGPGPLWSPSSGEPGAIWVAKRIPDGHVSVISNRARIGEIDLKDPNNYMASSNVKTFAAEMGWWDPNGKVAFNFHKTYNPTPYGSPYYQSRREWRVLSLLAPSLKLDPYAKEYPFSVKPDKKVSVQDMMKIFRDHYEGTEFDLTADKAAGPFGNPNRYPTPSSVRPEDRKTLDWERAISLFRCSYSFVGQARNWLPNAIGGVLWFGEDVPHSTVYMPIYAGVTSLPASISSGIRTEFDRNSAWWAFNFLSNFADLKYSYMIEDIKVMQNKFEGDFFAMQPAVEQAAVAMHARDPKLAVKYLTDYTSGIMNNVVDSWWKFSEVLIAKYSDGYVGGKSVGYPTEWLKEVGFGDTMLK